MCAQCLAVDIDLDGDPDAVTLTVKSAVVV